jgi:transposase InsO family protein
VSDITYIDLVDGCCYLHLVTDAYSHKIVGWCLSDTLEAEYTLEALRMAIGQATADELKGLIHHSDRGAFSLIPLRAAIGCVKVQVFDIN